MFGGWRGGLGGVLFRFHLGAAFADGHEEHAGEDEDHGHDLQEGEGVHAPPHGDDAGDDGLHVAIHADDGRAQIVLAHGRQQVAEERPAADHESDSKVHHGVERAPFQADEAFVGEGEGAKRGEKEHPFHQRHGGIAADEGLEQHEVEREADLGQHAQHVARHVSALRRGGLPAAQDEEQGAARPEDDAAHFLAGDGFFQVGGGDEHGEDGGACGDDRGVHRRRESQPESEQALVEHNTEQRGDEKQQHVAPRHFFPFGEQRGNPEQGGGARHAAVGQDKRGDGASQEHEFRHGRHEPPHGVGGEHGEMSFYFICFHVAYGFFDREIMWNLPKSRAFHG